MLVKNQAVPLFLAHPCFFLGVVTTEHTVVSQGALLDGKCGHLMLACNNEGLLPNTERQASTNLARRVVRGFSTIQGSPVPLQHSGLFQKPTAPKHLSEESGGHFEGTSQYQSKCTRDGHRLGEG
ncbi:hypothetical protein QBC45DRAFT_488783 [Copromyces sp. CBS 386.78]|nr:hypothetical protein QBC45DRAFT_488783 [Copromyces sp. CBS 386.78]